MQIIKKIDAKLHLCLFWTLFFIGAGITVVVFLGVLFRYVFKAPLPWAEELSRYLMVWGASLGAAVAYKEGSHVAVTVAIERLPQMVAKWMVLLGRLAVGFFAVVALIWGFVLIERFKGQTSPAIGIPMAIPYLSVPIGCLLILFQTIVLTLTQNKEVDVK
jgi:TRAP-type C4-dicarboxylate transport system permease small subunit